MLSVRLQSFSSRRHHLTPHDSRPTAHTKGVNSCFRMCYQRRRRPDLALGGEGVCADRFGGAVQTGFRKTATVTISCLPKMSKSPNGCHCPQSTPKSFPDQPVAPAREGSPCLKTPFPSLAATPQTHTVHSPRPSDSFKSHELKRKHCSKG